MTEDEHVKIGGALPYWKLSPATSLDILAERFRAMGYEKYIPEPRTPLSCLRGALTDMFTRDNPYVVRPVKNDKQGFAVVSEKPGEHVSAGDDWGTVVATATLDDDGRVELDPRDGEKRRALQGMVEEAAKWLPQNKVAKALVELIDRFDGVCLRQSGGVYWIDKRHINAWRQVREAVHEAASPGTKSYVYGLTIVADDEMVRAVGDALTDEIEHDLAVMEAELNEGDLREHACMSRVKRAGKLSEKVKRYEAAFASPLPDLQAKCQRAAAAAAMGVLEQSASDQQPVTV